MNIVNKSILGLAIALSAIATFGKSSYAEPKFFCDQEQMSTVVHSHWGELPMIRWTDTSFPPPYTPVERCQQVTARFNKFNDDGTLKYMRYLKSRQSWVNLLKRESKHSDSLGILGVSLDLSDSFPPIAR